LRKCGYLEDRPVRDYFKAGVMILWLTAAAQIS